MSLPYIPLYVDDYEADTAHLTIIEDGVYNRLLRLLWRTPGCSIPDDEAWIFRRLRAHTDDEKAAVLSVIAEFFRKQNGRVFSPRLTREFKKVDETSRKRSEAGKRGGRPQAIDNKTNEPKPGIIPEIAGPKHPEPYPEPYPEAAVAAAHGGEKHLDPTPRERLLAAMGIGPDGIAGPSAIIGTQVDVEEAGKWATMGISLDQQCAVIAEVCTRYRQKSPGWMPRRFSFFSGSMADLVESRNKPVPSGNPKSQPSDREAKKARWRTIAAGS